MGYEEERIVCDAYAAGHECWKIVSCGICLMVIKDPSCLEPCGHVFCAECVAKLYETAENGSVYCPEDRCKVDNPNGNTTRDFKQMYGYINVKCVWYKYGCPEVLVAEHSKKHELEECSFRQVAMNSEGCSKCGYAGSMFDFDKEFRTILNQHDCIIFLKESIKMYEEQQEEIQKELYLKDKEIEENAQDAERARQEAERARQEAERARQDAERARRVETLTYEKYCEKIEDFYSLRRAIGECCNYGEFLDKVRAKFDQLKEERMREKRLEREEVFSDVSENSDQNEVKLKVCHGEGDGAKNM